jgi:hypothetical protein
MIPRNIGLITVLFVTISATPIYAVSYPFSYQQEQNIDKHQVGRIYLSIDAQGAGTLTHEWSNGTRTSGNTFYSVVVLVGKNGKPIYSDKQTKGLDGSWGGRAKEGAVTTNFKLNQDQMMELDHVTFKMGAMNCGMELASFRCCNKGIEFEFTTHKCGRP